jgi:hypothetical protein
MDAPSRRSFLRRAGVIGALGVTGAVWRSHAVTTGGDDPAAEPGSTAFSMAMHIHASWSEGTGSMLGHLDQAASTGVDVIWWSEHDQRMSAHRYRREVHFDALTEYEDGQPWTWTRRDTGSLAASAGGIVTAPVSSRDTHAPGALRVAATSAGNAEASRGYVGTVEHDLTRTSLDGHTVEIDVHPTSTSRSAYLALDIVTSYRPATGGRTAGKYTLSYRVGGTGEVGSATSIERVGVVTLEAPPGQWTTLVVDPAADIAAIWPDLDGRDGSLYLLTLQAVSRNKARAEGFFDLLRFNRTRSSGNLPLETQSQLMAAYSVQYPMVRQEQALEISLVKPHLGWYGGELSLPDHTGEPVTPNTSQAAAQAAVKMIHAAGGLASYNHPFETGGPYGDVEQESLRRTRAAQLIGNRALGCDLLEVGYRMRGGVKLGRHALLWDACSRNGIFLTGTGVSDDHSGEDWLSQRWNFLTWAWAPDASRSALVAALAAGRVFFGDPARFRGHLDLLVDGSAGMGSVTVSTAASRNVRIIATGLPSGGTVETVSGLVDFAGVSSP